MSFARRSMRSRAFDVLGGGQSRWLSLSIARHGNTSGPETFATAPPVEVRRFFPPREGPGEAKSKSFGQLVGAALRDGDAVELRAIGSRGAWHVLSAVAMAPVASSFKVALVSLDNSKTEGRPADDTGRDRALRIIAQKAQANADFDTAAGFFVSNDTRFMPLAKKLDFELRAGAVVVHTYADAERAMEAILKALATAPKLSGRGDQSLSCTAKVIEHVGRAKRETVPRIAVRAHWDVEEETSKTDGYFTAYPPGDGADPTQRKRFEKSVHDRLFFGQTVRMQCRGRHAVAHAFDALAHVQGRVAEVEASWVDSPPSGEGAASSRAIMLHATPAESWSDFNSTDFKRTNKMVATASTRPGGLARAIGSEVGKLGCVAVHMDADDLFAIDKAVKALASIPVEWNGMRAVCVPSFGKARDSSRTGGGGLRSLRLYVRQRT